MCKAVGESISTLGREMCDYVQDKKDVCPWSWRAAAGLSVRCVQMTQVQSSGVGYWQTKYSKLQEQSMLSL